MVELEDILELGLPGGDLEYILDLDLPCGIPRSQSILLLPPAGHRPISVGLSI